MLLKGLSLCCGPSGMENETREYINNVLNELNISHFTDNMGSIIAHNEGDKSKGSMAVFAPMDECSFVVSSIEKDGFLRFKVSGNIDPRSLIAKPIQIIPGRINGVIGSCMFRQIKKEEYARAVNPEEKLYIDIGCSSEEEARSRVRIGDRIVFNVSYRELGENRVKLRSADTKAACMILIELLKRKPDVDFYACFCAITPFSVYGNKSFLGGLCAANRIHPKRGILLTGIDANDIPGQNAHKVMSSLGAGIALKQWSGSYVYDKRLTARVQIMAKSKGISIQLPHGSERENFNGSTLACAGDGISLLELSIPCRYRNTPVAMVDRRDIKSGIELVHCLVTEFDWRV